MYTKIYFTFLFAACFLAFGCRHQRSDKILVIFRGDSFCSGIGSSGTSSSATFSTGEQVEGPNTWGKQLQHCLDSINKGKYVVDMVGYPGQTSNWYLHSSEFQEALKQIKDSMDNYSMVVFCPEFGTNDEVMPGVDKPGYADTLLSKIYSINKKARNAVGDNTRFKIIGYPLTNRGDKYAKINTDNFRTLYNSMIIKAPESIGADIVLNYQKYPELFSKDAHKGKFINQNDSDHLSGVHPNDAGYGVLAKIAADAVIKMSKPDMH